MLRKLFALLWLPKLGKKNGPIKTFWITGSDAQSSHPDLGGFESQDWLEAFEHHPRIGDRQALAARFASTRNWSANEQAGVEMAEEVILDRLASGNDQYSQRFGYVFLVCATGKSALEMLNLLEARINNSPEEELQIAQQEQQKIMLLRLDKMFEESKK